MGAVRQIRQVFEDLVADIKPGAVCVQWRSGAGSALTMIFCLQTDGGGSGSFTLGQASVDRDALSRAQQQVAAELRVRAETVAVKGGGDSTGATLSPRERCDACLRATANALAEARGGPPATATETDSLARVEESVLQTICDMLDPHVGVNVCDESLCAWMRNVLIG
eukprot:4060773-Pleurochrysis_carterae.AAC.3